MKRFPRHDVRLPDERARLRAHEGHARVARLPGGGGARRRRPDPLQHLLDPREGRRPLQLTSGAKRLKREDPERIVGVGGCWAQSVKEQVFRQFPFVDVSCCGQVHKLAEFLQLHLLPRDTSSSRASPAACRPSAPLFSRAGRISVGCNCRCSYCIVPSTRGARGQPPVRRADRRGRAPGRRRRPRGHAARAERQLLRARPAARAREFRRAAAPPRRDLDLRRAHPLHEPTRSRGEDVVRAHAELASVCEHIHLPLQGSSRILRRCGAPTTASATWTACGDREHVPDVALTTDIIVGLPGRPRTSGRPSRSPRRSATTARSRSAPRRGTEAADLPDDVAHEEKVECMERLVEVVQCRAREAPSASSGAARAGRGAVADRSLALARPHAAQQGRELLRARRPRRSRGRGDPRGHEPDAGRGGALLPARAGRLRPGFPNAACKAAPRWSGQ